MCRGEGAESVEAEEAGHAGEHVEDDNGGPFDAADEAPEEVRHVGVARAEERSYDGGGGGDVQLTSSGGGEDDEEVGDVPQLVVGDSAEPGVEERVGEAEEGTVAESGRVEPASRGVHQEVQRGDEAAEAGVVESVFGDDQPWKRLTCTDSMFAKKKKRLFLGF